MAEQKTLEAVFTVTGSGGFTVNTLTSIGQVQVSSVNQDVTTLGNEFRKNFGTLKEVGPVALQGILTDQTEYDSLMAFALSQKVREVTIMFPSGSGYELTGYFSDMAEGEMTTEGVRTWMATLTVNDIDLISPTPSV
jgi:hypothetical protein